MPTVPLDDDRAVVAALLRGDDQVFAALMNAYGSAMLRVALSHVPSRAVADEVIQETWVGVLRGLDRFEGRSSLKTWIFKILMNIAMSRGERERRSVPFSALAADETSEGPSVDPDRFLAPDHDRWPEHWALGPSQWPVPEERLLAGETREVILRAIDELPPAQRTVVTMRDLEGWDAAEVCHALGVSEGNQRVLLHRGRTKVRSALESYFGAVERTIPG